MRDNKTTTPAKKGRCFVVMGFGIKTDYATGRKLDLNKSYKLLIRPVVEEKGLDCVRADELRHSGSIDLPMYRELLQADVVIADLSTANPNALYELGIRHALRPYTTIVISEDKLAYPFDLNHIRITSYTHLGEGIEFEEVGRFRKVLGETLQAVLDRKEEDSPVYTFLDGLLPPCFDEERRAGHDRDQDNHHEQEGELAVKVARGKTRSQLNKPLSLLIEQGEAAIDKKDFVKAKKLFESALLIGHEGEEGQVVNRDPYLVHRLALCTYKAQKPDAIKALDEGLALLDKLDLAHTNDPETVTLAGAMEKKYFELGQGDEHLSKAILLFQRGAFLLNNRYNCINLAYMQNCRANSSLCTSKEERIADMVYANHTRRRVLEICDKDLTDLLQRESRETTRPEEDEVMRKQRAYNNEQKFWIYANKAEAHFALGEFKQSKKAEEAARAIDHKPWMIESYEEQKSKLRVLLERNGYLLNPPWMAGS